MTMWIKGVAAALVLAGSAFLASEPAQARVSFGIHIGPGGYPGPYYRGGYDPACDPYSRWYNPYRCDDDWYYDDYYNGGIFIDGIWFDSGHWRHRHRHGTAAASRARCCALGPRFLRKPRARRRSRTPRRKSLPRAAHLPALH